jgi:hypothetical protein
LENLAFFASLALSISTARPGSAINARPAQGIAS